MKRWISPLELRCSNTLVNGQCFGWRPVGDSGKEWCGVIGDKVVTFREVGKKTF